MPSSQLPGPIAVIDVETTGLFPLRHDRVVEVAAIVIDGEGRIVREFVSLVNPARDIGPSSIHGLTAQDLLHAPKFGEIAGLLFEALQGTFAIAGHNVRFEQQFIENECFRLNAPVPQLFTICTMQLAGGGSLTECCGDYGIPLSDETHHALADARATTRLLSMLLPDQPRVLQNLSRLTPIQWPIIPRTEKQPITRDESCRRQSEPPTFLQRLLGRMRNSAEPIATDGEVMAYVALLDGVLEDRHVDDSEADALLEMAAKWGLGGEQIDSVHREYFNQLAIAAVADGVVTEVERRDLQLVAHLLGQGKQDMGEILREAAAKVASTPLRTHAPLNAETNLDGMRVCFTGELQCWFNGRCIPREVAEELAASAGLIVMESVTKKLDLLVLADPHSQSGKAKKARQYGIRIMHEPVFWKTIGVNVE